METQKRSQEELDKLQRYFSELAEAAPCSPPEERTNRFLEKLQEVKQQRNG